MPTDTYLVRFAADEEGREVNHERIVSTSDVPWPPHQYAAMAVAHNPNAAPDESNQMLAIVVAPDNTLAYPEYVDHLAGYGETLSMMAALNFPGHTVLKIVWFIRAKASKMTDEEAASPIHMRGALYRPTTEDELKEWAGEAVTYRSEEANINYQRQGF